MNTISKTLFGVVLVGTGSFIAMTGKSILAKTIKVIL